MNVLLITGGTFDETFAKDYIQSRTFDYIITADGGLAYAKAMHIVPDRIVGDFDTLSSDVLQEYEKQGIDVLQYPTKKDDTDTQLALQIALEQRPKSITILAGTGTRLDHTLANIGLLTLALEQGVLAELVDSNNRIRMIKDTLVINKQEEFGTYISLIPYTERVTGITLEGFLYPLQREELCIGVSRGISNELINKQGIISIESGRLLVIESKD